LNVLGLKLLDAVTNNQHMSQFSAIPSETAEPTFLLSCGFIDKRSLLERPPFKVLLVASTLHAPFMTLLTCRFGFVAL
jgi:hypothetical protein